MSDGIYDADSFLSDDYQYHIAETLAAYKVDNADLDLTADNSPLSFTEALEAEYAVIFAASLPFVPTDGKVLIRNEHRLPTGFPLGFQQVFNKYLDTYFREGRTNPRPRDWNAFISTWYNFAYRGSAPAAEIEITPTSYQGFVVDTSTPPLINITTATTNASPLLALIRSMQALGPGTELGDLVLVSGGALMAPADPFNYWAPFVTNIDSGATPPDETISGAAFLKGAPLDETSDIPDVTATADVLTSVGSLSKVAQDTFGAFLQTLALLPAGTDPVTDNQLELEEKWVEFAQRTTLPEAIWGSGAGTLVPFGANANLDDVRTQGYNEIYYAYLGLDPNDPDAQAQFEEELIRFADKMYEEQGYFYPNHFVETWVDTVKAAAIRNQSLAILDPTLTEERVQQALILNEIFDLLVDMIGAIQQVTSAVANRLRFYADYQRQLTKLMDQMPVFNAGDNTPLATVEFEGEGDQKREKYPGIRADANAANQATLENLRAHRDMVGDETKQLQTTVNQLNDAASQQGNIATAILQQLSGILTLIFR